METKSLQVNMLGTFSIRCADQEIQDSSNRSYKVWLLLAYLIYYRKHTTPPVDLSELLWGSSDSTSNPDNALKTTLHRARAFLDHLYPSAGHDLILRRRGNYVWNTEIPLSLDLDDFESLCKAGENADSDTARINAWLQALTLYQGDFLSRLSSEIWVVPIASYYHQLYLRTAFATINLLARSSRWEECEALCRKALKFEPYDETLCCSLMRTLMQLNRSQEAAALYDEMCDYLLSNFGVMPSDESRSLYREANSSLNRHTIAPSTLAEQLKEPPNTSGALFCDYDFFRVIYHSIARGIARNGDTVHAVLFSVGADDLSDLPQRSLTHAMDSLKAVLLSSLRRGDIVSRCSISQYVVLLPQANFESSQQVATRVVKAFSRKHPHSPATIRTSIQPVDPTL